MVNGAYRRPALFTDYPRIAVHAHTPLDPDLKTSLKIVLNLALRATTMTGLSDKNDPDVSFVGYRDATLLAAQQLDADQTFPGHPNLVESVKLAWAAVSLPPDSSDASDVTPVDNAPGVDPWVTFTWPTIGSQSGESWDFELADSPTFDLITLKYPPAGITPPAPITDTIEQDGKTVAFFQLALPQNSVTRYYWRVRPHSTTTPADPWLGCYPVHSFTNTGTPPTSKNVEVLSRIADGGTVLPGDFQLKWDHVDGATAFDTWVAPPDAPDDPGCVAVTGTIETQFGLDPDCSGAPGCDALHSGQIPEGTQSPGLLAKKHYWIDLRPIGPKDFSGEPSVGACSNTQINTTSMRTPVPDINGIFDDGQNLDGRFVPERTLQWRVFDGAVQSRLRFFEIDGQGHRTSNVTTKVVDTPCGDECLGTVTGDFLPNPPNPSGYFWDVTTIASDTQESSTSDPQGQILFFHENIHGVSPGELSSRLQPSAHPSPLPGNSYGHDVTFTWKADLDPTAYAYGFRLGRWGIQPIPDPSPTDPGNCGGMFGAQLECYDRTPAFFQAPSPVTGASFTVPGSLDPSGACTGVACGRYCWTVWPLFQSSDAPGTERPQKPFVELTENCYTSGPSKPRIVIDNPPPATGFSGEPVFGHIDFDYVPDGQVNWSGNNPDIAFDIDPTCKAAPGEVLDPATSHQFFIDLYNCKVNFKITPHEKQNYSITAKVWNSAVSPPVMDDSTLVFSEDKSVATASCGGSTEPCCTNNSCDSSALICKSGTCQSCGTHGMTCCAGNVCHDSSSCISDKCCTAVGSKPELHLPLRGSIVQSPPVQASIGAVPGAVSYEVTVRTFSATCQVDSQGNPICTGSNIELPGSPFISSVNSTDFFIDNIAGASSGSRLCSWSVTAIGDCGQRSAPSETSAFYSLE
jgi:hypothetical protein